VPRAVRSNRLPARRRGAGAVAAGAALLIALAPSAPAQTVPRELLETPRDAAALYELAMEGIHRWHGYGTDRLALAERTLERMPMTVATDRAYRQLVTAELVLRRNQYGGRDEGRRDVWRLALQAFDADRGLAETHLLIGRLELEAGCAACAGVRAEAARKLDRGHPDAALLRAFAAADIGDFPSAARWLRESAQLAADRWPAPSPERPARKLSRRIDLLVTAARAAAAWRQPGDADGYLGDARELATPGDAPGSAAEERAGWVRLRSAEYLLFAKGDAAGAAAEADTAGRLTIDPDARVVRDLARYLACAAGPAPAQRQCFTKVAADARLPPQDAFMKLARSPRTSAATTALLTAKIVKDVNARDGRERTALLYAAAGDNLDVAKRLVQAGANVNARSQDGMSAASLFARAGNAEAIRYLLSKGARIEDDEEAERLLLFAVQRDDVALARIVIDGATGTARSVDLTALLRAAAMGGRIQSARFLLQRGANAAERDWSGASALDYARATGHLEMIRLLEGSSKTSA
jgi:hypothetical protein